MTGETQEAPVEHRDIHTHFGLSYANYLVLHRTLLQSMPEEWQHQFVTLLEQFNDAFQHVKQAEAYEVIPGASHIIGEMVESELHAAGITAEYPDERSDEEEEVAEEDQEVFYNDRNGRQLYEHDRVIVPGEEPIPHYNRGRTRIAPMLAEAQRPGEGE